MIIREKRTSERVRRRNKVQITPYFPDDPRFLEKAIHADLEDVSKGGIGFLTKARLEPGMKLQIRLDLELLGIAWETDRYLVTDGEVRTIKPEGDKGLTRVGVRFTNTPPKEQAKWLKYLGQIRELLY